MQKPLHTSIPAKTVAPWSCSIDACSYLVGTGGSRPCCHDTPSCPRNTERNRQLATCRRRGVQITPQLQAMNTHLNGIVQHSRRWVHLHWTERHNGGVSPARRLVPRATQHVVSESCTENQLLFWEHRLKRTAGETSALANTRVNIVQDMSSYAASSMGIAPWGSWCGLCEAWMPAQMRIRCRELGEEEPRIQPHM